MRNNFSANTGYKKLQESDPYLTAVTCSEGESLCPDICKAEYSQLWTDEYVSILNEVIGNLLFSYPLFIRNVFFLSSKR